MATKIDEKNNNNFVFEVRENSQSESANHEMTVVSLLSVLQQDFAPVEDDKVSETQAAATSADSGMLTEAEAMKLLLKVVQMLQVWATELARVKDQFGSDLGKINLDFMKVISEISKRISEKQFQAYVEEKKKQEEAQKAQTIFSICIGVLSILGNLLCGNVAGAVVAAVMLVATLPVFDNNQSLLDMGKAEIAKALESLGADKETAKFIADGLAFVIIAATLFAGSAGAASSSLSNAAKIALSVCKYSGVILEAAATSGLATDAVKAIVEDCYKPTGDKAADEAQKDLIATIATAVVMLLGVIFGSVANYHAGEASANEKVIQALSKVFGKTGFEMTKRATIFLEILAPIMASITQGVQNAQLADNKFEQADLLEKYARIMSNKEFIESMNKLIDAMVGGDHKNLQSTLGLIEKITQGILEQFGIFQKTAEVLG